jgi:hypothetical protein
MQKQLVNSSFHWGSSLKDLTLQSKGRLMPAQARIFGVVDAFSLVNMKCAEKMETVAGVALIALLESPVNHQREETGDEIENQNDKVSPFDLFLIDRFHHVAESCLMTKDSNEVS